jgi:hypothetical protein
MATTAVAGRKRQSGVSYQPLPLRRAASAGDLHLYEHVRGKIVQTYGHGRQGALQRLHRGTERPAEIRSRQTLRAREGEAR